MTARTPKSAAKGASRSSPRKGAARPAVEGPAVEGPAAKEPGAKCPAAQRPGASPVAAKPRLLGGGNPQIVRGEGDGPVQAYIAAMPGWKRDVGRCLDKLITAAVPAARKAVKWNSPLYGLADQGWFLGVHCLARYVKVAFFRGASLHPVPPGASRNNHTRYVHIHEGDTLDEKLFVAWVKQASRLPGENL